MDINITDREKIEQLKEPDIYSMLLFALFKLKNDPKYSTLSIFEYFGGLTIKVPTISEFKLVLNALILFGKVNIGNVDYNTALREFDKTKNELQEIEETYATLCKVIKDYDFRRPE